ncbi:MAG: helix-turn-helix transcriptional regulator [Alphaproteobacteria bacterium]|nr:helix-turn-helix transcriptional regulator [Alphaproteobacteria bacterium]
MKQQTTEDKNKRVTHETTIIGRNIRNLRTRAGYSQQDIAKALGVSFQQIQKYEAGKNRFPAETLYRLKKFYGVPYPYFFEGMDGQVTGSELRGKIEQVISILQTVCEAKSDE